MPFLDRSGCPEEVVEGVITRHRAIRVRERTSLRPVRSPCFKKRRREFWFAMLVGPVQAVHRIAGPQGRRLHDPRNAGLDLRVTLRRRRVAMKRNGRAAAVQPTACASGRS